MAAGGRLFFAAEKIRAGDAKETFQNLDGGVILRVLVALHNHGLKLLQERQTSKTAEGRLVLIDDHAKVQSPECQIK